MATHAHVRTEAEAHGDVHPEGASVFTYTVVFIALLVLLFASVGIAYIRTNTPAQRDWLTAAGYAIATAKAVLVIMFFMHVKYASRLTWIFSTAAFFFLAIMFALTLNDYNTRQTIPGAERENPWIAEPNGQAQGYVEAGSTGKNYPAQSDPRWGK